MLNVKLVVHRICLRF